MGIPKKRNEQIVVFTENIFEDLMRRDFSVNSLAYDGKNLIFLGSALNDLLEKKSLKFNGDGRKRVLEDPLRLLRGIRFSLTKNLILEDEDIYKENIHLISNLSIERIRDEFIKILLSQHPSFGIKKLVSMGAMRYIIPEIIPLNLEYLDVLEDSSKNLETRLYLLLKELPHREILFRLKFSKKIVLKVQELKTPFSKKNLEITGRDLKNLGLSGKGIGDALDQILNLVLDGKLKNNQKDIISFLKKSEVSK